MEIMLESILWCIEGVLELYFILAVVNVALYWCMHFNVIGQGGPAFKKFLAFLHQITEPVYAKLRERIKPVLLFISVLVIFLLTRSCSRSSTTFWAIFSASTLFIIS